MLLGGRHSETNAEIVGGSSGYNYRFFSTEIKTLFFTDGKTFTLVHSGDRACGIADGDTFVMVGGGEQIHNFATR